MKKISYLLSIAISFLFSGCIHEYPVGEGTDPTLTTVEVALTLDLEWGKYQTGSKATTRSSDSHRRRFIVEVQREGETVLRHTIISEDFTEGQYQFYETLILSALQYDVAIWTDYAEADTQEGLYYDTGDLENITNKEPYTGNTDYRDCHYATVPLDLGPYRNQWNTRVQLDVEMTRPLAKYRIIATDAADFLKIAGNKFPGQTEFNVRFAYGFYFPLTFNVWSGKPTNSQLGVAFTGTLTLPAAGTEELLLMSDHIFVNGTGSYIPLSIEITTVAGELVGRLGKLDIPYERGHITTIRGRFLTAMFGSGGIGIDSGFDGDIDIDLDKL